MKNINVTLYGHLTVDKILVDFREQISLGGIANVWYGIRLLNQNMSVNICPTDIGEAIILVDKSTNQRFGRGCLNLDSRKVAAHNSNWHHIAYINQITHTGFIEQIQDGVVSADITKEAPEKVLPHLKYIDYLFISEEDLFMDIKELAMQTKGWVICHSPMRSVWSDGTNVSTYNIPEDLLLDDVNVLGAGDYFASGFINSTILGINMLDSIKNAHQDTTNILREQLT